MALLALKKVSGYSSETQIAVFWPVLQNYSIINKLEAIISDNTSTNNILCYMV